MSKPTKHAISLYEQPDFQVAGPALAALENSITQQVQVISRGEREQSIRVVLTGLALQRVKASLKHGKWEPWIKTNLVRFWGKAAPRTAQYWMQLGDKFVDDSQITVPDFLALPGTQTELPLESDNAKARRMMEALDKFVGDLGPTDLMIEWGVRGKKLGGKRIGAPATPVAVDAEQLAAHARAELSGAHETLRQLLLTDNVCQHLSRDEIRAFDKSLTAMLDRWRSALRATLAAPTAS